MIEKEVKEFAEKNWSHYIKSISECSKPSKDKAPLVESEIEVYCFDDICKKYFDENRLPASVDCVDFTEKEIYLVEFKSGFREKITKENYKKSEQAICEHMKGICEYYWSNFFKLRDIEKEELISNLKLKAIDTYMVFGKKVFPLCDKCESKRLHLIVVIDADYIDNMEDTLGELAGCSVTSNNWVTKIKNSLSRFKVEKDALGNDYLYDEIDVYTVQEYKHFMGI